MKTLIVLLLLVLLNFLSCNSTDDLKVAFSYAEENSAELQKVLDFYKDPADSLKLRAAKFLIKNMPYHYSYQDPQYFDIYYDEVANAVNSEQEQTVNKEIYNALSAKYDHSKTADLILDVKVIKADYLIDNIERSFDVWQNGEWAKHVDFDEFCEYILPYKTYECQTLDNWREYCYEAFNGDLENLHLCYLYQNSAYWACGAVNDEIINLQQQLIPADLNVIPVLKIESLFNMPFGTCSDYSLLALSLMRSKGIPVMEDYTPQWPFMRMGHNWNIVLANSGKNVVFSGGNSNPGEPHKPAHKMAKVFRRTYSYNKEIKEIRQTEKYVPSFLASICLKDVTDEYMKTCDVELDIPSFYKNLPGYAYLAVFDNRRWAPVHWGKIKRGKVCFEKMGKDIMYLPVFCTEDGIQPFSSPFLLTLTGDIEFIEPDTTFLNSMIVRRKYFEWEQFYGVKERLRYGKFQVANKADFSDCITFYQFPDYVVTAGEIDVKERLDRPYRYWRYYSAEEQYNNMAELYFYPSGSAIPHYGKIIGTPGSFSGKERNMKEAVFDGDPLTFYDALTESDSWVGVDFGKPLQIDRIGYVPRGDGNDVYPGDEYELFYWQDHKWTSVGRRISKDIKLIYNNIPANTLYWLHNHTKGIEERIFTYQDGKQIFW